VHQKYSATGNQRRQADVSGISPISLPSPGNSGTPSVPHIAAQIFYQIQKTRSLHHETWSESLLLHLIQPLDARLYHPLQKLLSFFHTPFFIQNAVQKLNTYDALRNHNTFKIYTEPHPPCLFLTRKNQLPSMLF
jgi:hypothetical protein